MQQLSKIKPYFGVPNRAGSQPAMTIQHGGGFGCFGWQQTGGTQDLIGLLSWSSHKPCTRGKACSVRGLLTAVVRAAVQGADGKMVSKDADTGFYDVVEHLIRQKSFGCVV